MRRAPVAKGTQPAAPRRMGSVVIPAHNEAAVIRRSLDALFTDVDPAELDVVVVCNGCTDGTADLARSSGHPVRVLELSSQSKAAALRAGDSAAVAFPRLYLDADVVLFGSAARRLLQRLRSNAVAARPPITFDSDRSSVLVRRYYRARARIPSLHGSLWGAGVYGLSEAGRSRFGEFPDLVGDDLWVDCHFGREEVDIVDCLPLRLTAPRRPRDLMQVLRRTYRGNGEQMAGNRADQPAPKTTAVTLRDLGRLVATSPVSALDAAIYAAFAVGGRLSVRLSPMNGVHWERDESSRQE
jgi:hypothetical protein